MEVEIQFQSVSDLVPRLQAFPGEMRAANLRAMQKSVLRGEAIAKGNVPRVTGQLFSSISGHVLSDTATEVTGEVGTNKVYAKAVNYGFPVGYAIEYRRGRAITRGPRAGSRTRPYTAHSRGRRPKPYLDPTLPEHANEVEAIVAAEAQAVLERL